MVRGVLGEEALQPRVELLREFDVSAGVGRHPLILELYSFSAAGGIRRFERMCNS